MDFRLEPMELGEIIDEAIELLKINFKDCMLVILVMYSPLFVYFFVNIGLEFFAIILNNKFFEVVRVILNLIMIMSSIFFWVLSVIAIYKIVYNSMMGEEVKFKHILKYALKNFKRVFWAYALVLFMCLVIGASGIFAGVMIGVGGRDPLYSAIGVIVALVFFLGTFILFFLLATTPYISAMEKVGGIAAVKRAITLFMYGRDVRGKILTLPFVLQMIFIAGFLVPFVNYFVSIFIVGPLTIISYILLIYDIKVRYEGYDLEFAADKMLKQYENVAVASLQSTAK